MVGVGFEQDHPAAGQGRGASFHAGQKCDGDRPVRMPVEHDRGLSPRQDLGGGAPNRWHQRRGLTCLDHVAEVGIEQREAVVAADSGEGLRNLTQMSRVHLVLLGRGGSPAIGDQSPWGREKGHGFGIRHPPGNPAVNGHLAQTGAQCQFLLPAFDGRRPLSGHVRQEEVQTPAHDRRRAQTEKTHPRAQGP